MLSETECGGLTSLNTNSARFSIVLINLINFNQFKLVNIKMMTNATTTDSISTSNNLSFGGDRTFIYNQHNNSTKTRTNKQQRNGNC